MDLQTLMAVNQLFSFCFMMKLVCSQNGKLQYDTLPNELKYRKVDLIYFVEGDVIG